MSNLDFEAFKVDFILGTFIFVVGCFGGIVAAAIQETMGIYSNTPLSKKPFWERVGLIILVGGTSAVALWLVSIPLPYRFEVGRSLITGLAGYAVIVELMRREGVKMRDFTEVAEVTAKQGEKLDTLEFQNKRLKAIVLSITEWPPEALEQVLNITNDTDNNTST